MLQRKLVVAAYQQPSLFFWMRVFEFYYVTQSLCLLLSQKCLIIKPPIASSVYFALRKTVQVHVLEIWFSYHVSVSMWASKRVLNCSFYWHLAGLRANLLSLSTYTQLLLFNEDQFRAITIVSKSVHSQFSWTLCESAQNWTRKSTVLIVYCASVWLMKWNLPASWMWILQWQLKVSALSHCGHPNQK